MKEVEYKTDYLRLEPTKEKTHRFLIEPFSEGTDSVRRGWNYTELSRNVISYILLLHDVYGYGYGEVFPCCNFLCLPHTSRPYFRWTFGRASPRDFARLTFARLHSAHVRTLLPEGEVLLTLHVHIPRRTHVNVFHFLD